ncbi:hypothetical protein ANCCAN_11634 [Ancylostoma caninum]|uniref:Uncharacterized protein n=1 Tax=Ancylostoma caninum TaxID=29170 RepID=A0A368GH71_ANCCA|nr:hypothetical protein ANCCAN_11634 [Ancylostoma caninum]
MYGGMPMAGDRDQPWAVRPLRNDNVLPIFSWPDLHFREQLGGYSWNNSLQSARFWSRLSHRLMNRIHKFSQCSCRIINRTCLSFALLVVLHNQNEEEFIDCE